MNKECLNLLGKMNDYDQILFLRFVKVLGQTNPEQYNMGLVYGGLSSCRRWKATGDSDNELNETIWNKIKEIATVREFKASDTPSYDVLFAHICAECNNIALSSHRTAGNVFVYNNQFAPHLEKLAPYYNGEMKVLNGVIPCYPSHIDGDKPEAIIAYVGYGKGDFGNGYIEHEDNKYEFYWDVPGNNNYYRLIRLA